jgi:gluconolactonase
MLRILIVTTLSALLVSCTSIRCQNINDLQVKSQASIVAADAALELLWGEGSFTEGPAVAGDSSVLFTDIRNHRIMRFDAATGKTAVFRENSGSANGMAFDANGNLLVCEGADGGGRRVTKTNPAGVVSVVSSAWQGKRLNSPNDLAVAPNGDIYFTDPRYRGTEPRELDFEGVFVVRDGVTSLATDLVERPNGILISADGKKAFVADNHNSPEGARHLLRFDIKADGSFYNRLLLVDFGTGRRGIDGMAMDRNGNIYATAGKGENAGVYVFSPRMKLLAVIRVPDLPTNCTFAGPHLLYITALAKPATEDAPAKFGLYRIAIK